MQRLLLISLMISLIPVTAWADDVELKRQAEMIEAQRRLIEELQNRVEKLEKILGTTGQLQDTTEQDVLEAKQRPDTQQDASPKVASMPEGGSKKTAAFMAEDKRERDPIGDILSDAIYRGEFPGSILIPGPKGRLSMRIGGFMKAITYFDSAEVGSGDNFLPATITGNNDEKTTFSAAFSRLNLEVRCPSEWGIVKSFAEVDFQGSGGDSPRLRHAYGELAEKFLGGKYWSSFMDLSAIPDSVTEATVSGAIFARQIQFRWTENINEQTRLTFAVEEPDNDDFTTTDPSDEGQEIWPDFVITAKRQFDRRMHLQLGGILRRLEVEGTGNMDDKDFGWGFQLSSRINTVGRDSLIVNGVYGKGLGRYLLGTLNSAAVTTPGGNLKVLENYGGYISYRHFWNDRWWSNVTYGYAGVDNSSFQPDNSVHATQYGAVNLMWTPVNNFGVGLEYLYGLREDNAGRDDTAHRILFGLQVF